MRDLVRTEDAGARAVEAVVARVTDEVGAPERLVNAAAIAPTGPLLSQPMDEVRRLVEVNYLGLVAMTKAVVPAMVSRGRGQVVQFASLAGWLPAPHFGAYAATKFAVVAFTETLAHEVAGTGVRVLCVCPPIVETPLLDQVPSMPASMGLATSISPMCATIRFP